MRRDPRRAADLRIQLVVESGRYPSILDIMWDIHGISGVRRTTTTLRRSAHGPREHSGHLGVDPCSFPSFRAMKSASSRSSMPLVSAPGPNRPKGTKALGRVRPGRATYSLDPVLRAVGCEVRGRSDYLDPPFGNESSKIWRKSSAVSATLVEVALSVGCP
jgi:hypothetical protein